MNKGIVPYLKEFREAKKALFDSRLRLLSSLAVALYLALSIFYIVLKPSDFRKGEFFVWGFLLATGTLTFLASKHTKTLFQSRLNASIFTCSLVSAVVMLFCLYPAYAAQSSSVFALCVFLISFIMPWEVIEVVLIGAANAAAYSLVYLNRAGYFSSSEGAIASMGEYVDGMVFLFVCIIICTVIRHRDHTNYVKNFILMKELEKKNTQILEELALARDIQTTLIPRPTSTPRADIAVNYIPLSMVGGDYATFHHLKEGEGLFFLIGDITGHGVPAALLVNRVYGEVESLIARDPDPGKLMRQLNSFVQEHFKQTHMYFTVCAGLVDFAARTLFYSNYGHPPQILHQHKDNTIRLLESHTSFLGLDTEVGDSNVFEGSTKFDSNDRIVLFTDGLIETRNSSGALYGMESLEAFVRTHSNDSPQVFNANLLKEINAFRSGPLSDDMLLVTIDIK
ncbi:MAG: serine/threonine-protein phosphatase [Candidatus Omnitrophica bacterium]|nr:serine/threonine-protein phosphatase [Candidatus Omnitrophota bacterium]MCM8791244.1 serine/threonine-protein phosphatase [Candidatus Omnitrophota bacterium]